MALEALLNAGVMVTKAWEISARASGSFRIDREVSTWTEKIEAGAPPSELLRNNRAFPDVFANLYATGEASGRLDDHLQKLHHYYLESGMDKFQQVSTWIPRLVYLIIVAFIVKHILGFWMGYFKQIGELSDF
jgi:type II secretory pathway component PulF